MATVITITIIQKVNYKSDQIWTKNKKIQSIAAKRLLKPQYIVSFSLGGNDGKFEPKRCAYPCNSSTYSHAQRPFARARGSSSRVFSLKTKVPRKGTFVFGGGVDFKAEHRHRGMKFGIAPHFPDEWGRQLAAGGDDGILKKIHLRLFTPF